jgi:hypothetical protein
LADAIDLLEEAITAAWQLKCACRALHDVYDDPLHGDHGRLVTWLNAQSSSERAGWVLAESLLTEIDEPRDWLDEELAELDVDDGNPDALRNALLRYLTKQSAASLNALIPASLNTTADQRRRL